MNVTVKKFNWQTCQNVISILAGADWADGKKSLKTTSGGCLLIGDHLLNGWSKAQGLIALSSGESEPYATLSAVSEGLGMISIAHDLGIEIAGEVWRDASAPLGVRNRNGLGTTRAPTPHSLRAVREVYEINDAAMTNVTFATIAASEKVGTGTRRVYRRLAWFCPTNSKISFPQGEQLEIVLAIDVTEVQRHDVFRV